MQNRYAPMLFMPSLLSDDFITIANVTREEADSFFKFFDEQVENSRKMKYNPNAVDEPFDELKGNFNLEALIEDESLGDLMEVLSNSNIPGSRGRRAVFVDVENNVIGVGTTVVYNQNWAMKGVSDPSILTQVLNAVEEYE